MKMETMDFAVTWVDGSDPAWLAQRRKYENGGSAQARAGGEANAATATTDSCATGSAPSKDSLLG